METLFIITLIIIIIINIIFFSIFMTRNSSTNTSKDFSKDIKDLRTSLNNLEKTHTNDIESFKKIFENQQNTFGNFVNNIDNGILEIGKFKFSSGPDELTLTNLGNSSTGNAIRFRIPIGEEGYPPKVDNRIDIIASSGLNNKYEVDRWLLNSVSENVNLSSVATPSSYTPLGIFRRVPVPCNNENQPCAYNKAN